MSKTISKIFDMTAEWDMPGAVSAAEVVKGPWQQAEAKPAAIIPGGLKFTAVGDLAIAPPSYLIKNLIETDCLGSIFGEPGHGKSFFAIDLALCVASGRDFHGRKVQKGSAFYIAGEGHNGLARRTHAWADHNGISLEGLPMYASDKAANFRDPTHAEFVAGQIDRMVGVHGAPKLIVVDTLARNFGDGDENSTGDMSAFVIAMDDLRGRYPGSTILVVHHSGHGDKGRARGSSAFKAALDSEYQVAKVDGVVTVTCKKMKEGAEPAPFGFAARFVKLGEDEDGDEFGSLVLVPCDAPTKGDKPLTTAQRRGLDALHAAFERHGAIDEVNGRRGVKRENWKDAFKIAYTGEPSGLNSAFSQAIKSLEGRYVVHNDGYFQLFTPGGAGEN